MTHSEKMKPRKGKENHHHHQAKKELYKSLGTLLAEWG